jgi:GNAT superfamily N-acetyltransferase
VGREARWPIVACRNAFGHKAENCMSEIMIANGYVPGAIGKVAELHSIYYHDHWNFGLFFEAKVAVELSEFLKRYDENRDGFWTALVNGRVEGSIAIDGMNSQSEGAHLRWFIMSDTLRGKGAGNRLISTAISFCRCMGYGKIYLWTFEGLSAARHLYEKIGFKLVQARKGTQWGAMVNEQRFELNLSELIEPTADADARERAGRFNR